MKVIGIVGLPASGKGEFSRIAAEMGIPVVVMGDVIRAAVKEAGLSETDQNFGLIAQQLRDQYGMGAIAIRSVPFIRATGAPVALVDGIRGDAEVSIFRQEFPDFHLIGIRSEFSTRLARLSQRGRIDDVLSSEDLRRRDEREMSWGLDRALDAADQTLTNDRTIEEYAARVQTLLAELKGAA
jgi:dephospho-CoA kinase